MPTTTIKSNTKKIVISNNTEKIKVKYFATISHIEKIQQGDLIDLRCAKEMIIHKGNLELIPLGVAMQLPKGYKANLYPRSSTFKKFHILMANSVGQIDNSYCGDNDQWMFAAYATEDTYIPFNERIAQFEIVKIQPTIEFEEVEHLTNTDRNGFGSTDKK